MTELNPFMAKANEAAHELLAAQQNAQQAEFRRQQAMQAEFQRKREALARLLPVAVRVAEVARGKDLKPDITLGVDKGVQYQRKWYGAVKHTSKELGEKFTGWKIARYEGYLPGKTPVDDPLRAAATGGKKYIGGIMLSAEGQLITYRSALPAGNSPAILLKHPTPTNDYAKQSVPFRAYTLRDLPTLGTTTEETSPANTIHPITSAEQYPLPLIAEPEVIEQGLVEFVVHHGLKV